MAELDMKYVDKGQSEPREGLRDEGVVHVGLGKKHQEALSEYGWMETDTTNMNTLVTELDTSITTQTEAKQEAKTSTKIERAKRAVAKALIGKLRLGVSVLLKKEPVEGVTEDDFNQGTLGQNTAKIAMYLTKIQPAVEKLDEKLARFFKGQSALELVKSAVAELDAAQSEQEVNVKTTPRTTLEIYETKGRLLAAIEEMNKIAKIAFWDQKEIAGQFNKDILNRARKKRGGGDDAGVAE